MVWMGGHEGEGAPCCIRLGFAQVPTAASGSETETARREKPRGATRSGSIPFRTCFPGTLMTWNRHRRHTETGARTSRIFTHRSQPLEMANETA